ncbi:hypothetical protein EV401DRAFT_1566765 [Pisolithus croceorrhizus]|nr:hypothetical protein EV401DRAFT_1566765 [Pisolithus croceorrhizus]
MKTAASLILDFSYMYVLAVVMLGCHPRLLSGIRSFLRSKPRGLRDVDSESKYRPLLGPQTGSALANSYTTYRAAARSTSAPNNRKKCSMTQSGLVPKLLHRFSERPCTYDYKVSAKQCSGHLLSFANAFTAISLTFQLS